MSDSNFTKKYVIVLGAGVVGLTTALCLQETGRYQVEIIADVFPTDSKTTECTSFWAGAIMVDFASPESRQGKINRATLEKFLQMSRSGGEAEHCFLRIPHLDYSSSKRHLEEGYVSPHGYYPNFRQLEPSELRLDAQSGETFDTLTINVDVYLQWLLAKFLAKGGSIIHGKVQHIDQILEDGTAPFKEGPSPFLHPYIDNEDCIWLPARASPPDGVFVCVGIGARFLGGVEDKDVYPGRGQTVILHAPWVNLSLTYPSTDFGTVGEATYIIPRRNGNVVVGGVNDADDWYPKPRVETRDDILRRGLALCPELAPPEIRGRPAMVEDLIPLIVTEGVGFRPMRKGGARIQLEANGRNVPVVYNYGHGSVGYMSSFGSAEIAIKLFEGGSG